MSRRGMYALSFVYGLAVVIVGYACSVPLWFQVCMSSFGGYLISKLGKALE